MFRFIFSFFYLGSFYIRVLHSILLPRPWCLRPLSLFRITDVLSTSHSTVHRGQAGTTTYYSSALISHSPALYLALKSMILHTTMKKPLLHIIVINMLDKSHSSSTSKTSVSKKPLLHLIRHLVADSIRRNHYYISFLCNTSCC